MAKLKGPMSGFRDVFASDMIARQNMIETIRKVYESYGFAPLETPALEKFETLTGKYGPESEKLIYNFSDHGGRKVALRYDFTVPLARVIAQYESEIVLPYKRYQIGNVWRGESPQAGRYREFLQFDADIVGTKSVVSDLEILMMISDTTEALGINSLVRVNDRRILDALSQNLGISSQDSKRRLILLIDKIDKIGKKKVLEEVKLQFGEEVFNLVSKFLSLEGESQGKLKKIGEILSPVFGFQDVISDLYYVFDTLKKAGYEEDRIAFDPSLARGLDYYTGIIYETYLKDAPEIGSIAGGGRYDRLISILSDGKVDLPAIGVSIGVDRLFSALNQLGKLEKNKTKSKVLIVNFSFDLLFSYLDLAKKLRLSGIPSEVFYEPTKIEKQLRYADRLGIPWVVFFGEEEKKSGLIKIKNLKSGEQNLLSVEDFISFIKGSS